MAGPATHRLSKKLGRRAVLARVEHLAREFKAAQKAYDDNAAPLDVLGTLSASALTLLRQASGTALPEVSAGGKQYWIYRAGKSLSRPYLPGLLLADPNVFQSEWVRLLVACRPDTNRIEMNAVEVNRILYSAVMSFCLCYDLWKPKSRKTPGTQFEMVLGTLFARLLPKHTRSKHIRLADGESVSTDIVMMDATGERALVCAAKITTRERIVQAFAHQRILESAFPAGRYRSLIACVSEMQRDEEQGANEICVPGTIRLFQKHLARVEGLYYLDPPHRYLQPDLTKVVPVTTLGDLFTTQLPKLVAATQGP